MVKQFLKGRLTIGVKGNGLLYKQWDSDRLYNTSVQITQQFRRATRSVEVIVRYRLNTSRSKYKGTGAGMSEMGRF